MFDVQHFCMQTVAVQNNKNWTLLRRFDLFNKIFYEPHHYLKAGLPLGALSISSGLIRFLGNIKASLRKWQLAIIEVTTVALPHLSALVNSPNCFLLSIPYSV